tara:strand:+ start:71 stop:499 length:429 start_codon:yes stop_codon:yes gene_type:complete
MIGFVSALTASLSVIILVVLAALIGFVESILPETGLIKVNDYKYRYIQENPFIQEDLINKVLLEIESMKLLDDVKSYQVKCQFGYNQNYRQASEIATFNYLAITNYLGDNVLVGNIDIIESKEGLNTCFIDVNIKRKVKDER